MDTVSLNPLGMMLAEYMAARKMALHHAQIASYRQPKPTSIVKIHRDLGRSLHYLDRPGVLRARRDDVDWVMRQTRQTSRSHAHEFGKVLQFVQKTGQLTSEAYRERRENGRIELKRRVAAKRKAGKA